jgi:cytochrome c oxidase accessory protein FixG
MFKNLFIAKKRLYSQNVKGKIRNIKWILNSVFLAIYLFSPFIRFDRGDINVDQAIFIDLPNAKAYFFFIEIYPQEVYYLAGILIIAATALFFITSLFGRVWCGYACFQTVWTDIFIAFERLFQGDRNQRIILDRRNNFQKFYKKSLTHISWIIISIITGYGFVCYFHDSIDLTKNLFNGIINYTALGWTLGIAGATYLMAGFAREHVCTFMCPYARFQSAMFDDNTLIVSYDEKRGEPRGKLKNSQDKNYGDCISCNQCVVVCPTGIDIRDGLQMECIACGLCIDACDSIMEKIGKPKGLIRYDTLAHLADPIPQKKFKIFKARTLYYATILLVVSGIMFNSLITKPLFESSIIASRNPIFVKLSNGDIRNKYQIKILNKTHKTQKYQVKIIDNNFADFEIFGAKKINEKSYEVEIKANSQKNFRSFIILPKGIISKLDEGRILLQIEIMNLESKEISKESAVFIAK